MFYFYFSFTLHPLHSGISNTRLVLFFAICLKEIFFFQPISARIFLGLFSKLVKVLIITFLLSSFINRNRIFSPHKTNIFLKLEGFLWKEGFTITISRWRRESISTRIASAMYSWRLCLPRASQRESHKLREHGS